MWASDVELEPQPLSMWCGVSTTYMFIKHYFPNLSLSLNDILGFAKIGFEYDPHKNYISEENNVTGNAGDIQDAIIRFTNCTSQDVQEYSVYSKETVIQFLNDGHVLIIDVDYYEGNSTNSTSGHCFLVYGYVKVGNDYEFLIRDPGHVNQGMTRMFTYEELYCRSFTNVNNGNQGMNVWNKTIVKVTDYSSNTVPDYFGN